MIKAVTEGKIAGKLAYEIIDHVPDVKVLVKGTYKLATDGTVNGRIEFKDVRFKYPTRDDL